MALPVNAYFETDSNHVQFFLNFRAIVQCVQTAMYESVRASCTVEQVREAINSTLDDLQTVFPLAANSCSGTVCLVTELLWESGD